MSRSFVLSRLLPLLVAACVCAPLHAQSLPVAVDVAGNVATVRVGNAGNPLAEVSLSFDDASGLSPAALGVSAQLVSPASPALLARLPDPQLVQVDPHFPVLITVEPPAAGGLAFNRTVRVEVHTHALSYAVGSSFRLFKSPLGGSFRDITDEIAPGSVRARGTTGGFSQFLLVADVRDSDEVITAKFAALRAITATLPAAERAPLDARLNLAEQGVADADYVAANNALQSFRARVSARAGVGIPQRWRAARDLDNPAGELLAGASTLSYSISYKRDYGP